MTLYIDKKLNFTDANVVTTLGSWHPSLPLLAIGSYNQEKGGYVTIFQENGLALEGCDWPVLLSNQVTALAWHPIRKLLVVGWDGGELYIWLEYSWARLEAPHTSALTTVTFSSGGGRLLASDAAGSVSGWQSSSGAPLTAFHHQLGDIITLVKFCAPHATSETSIRGLARAAVEGDENALDALAAWRPRTTAKMREGLQPDNHACYAAQDNGIILYIDHAGACSEVLNSPGVIVFMEIISTIYLLVAWETGGALSLSRFSISHDGSLTTDTHVRMSARNGQCVVLAGSYCVAVITGDNLIRIWDSENGDNDVLPNENDETVPGDIFTSISYCNLSDTLCCGTAQGNLYLWRRDHRNRWKLISSTSVKGTVKEVSWGSEGLMNPLLYVNCITNAFVLREQHVCWGYSNNMWMVQKSAHEVTITGKLNSSSNINPSITIKTFAFKDNYIALGDGKDVQIWMHNKENDLKFTLIRTFAWKTDVLILYNDMLVGLVNPHIECYNISGTKVGVLPSSEGEGEPIAITNTNKFIVIATIDGSLKLAEITKKGLRMPYPAKNCYQMIEDFGEIMRSSVNNTGLFICLSIANAGLAPDPRIYLWDVANDVITHTLLSDSKSPPYQSVPIAILWDHTDPRLVAVHMRSSDFDHIHLFFCHESKLYEYKNWCASAEEYFASDFISCSLYAPYVVILTQQNVTRILMKEFEDRNDVEPNKLKQVLNFLFYMTTGHLEKAVVIGTNISGSKNSIFWDSLAKMCVTLKRAEVGSVCLTKMGNIKGALMMRKVLNDDSMSDTAKVGVLAVNLGMIDEAEKLFREAQRPDLITRLISAKEGGLNEIINSENEGENLLLIKSAQHKLAKIMWANGETTASLKLFESAGTLVPHVPRMLIAQGQAPVLAQYVSTSKDSNLITWWGHYLESIGDLDGALVAYARANDFGEQTRLLCYMDRIEEAEKLCQKNKSSLYQMARYLEMSANQTENAVKMYIKCGAITSAIRVAAEASAWNLVWRAGSSSPKHAVYAASILENAGQNERAIALYQKAGHLEKAVVIGTNISGSKNSIFWDSLAKMCVTLKRAEVGSVCLTKMGNIKGALMMRKVLNDDSMSDTAKVGVLAVNLGMIDEAEKLFREAQRPDLITRLISAKEGGLNEIINSENEGENLLLIKSAQHKLAKIMWANGETTASLKLFESAGTLVPHVPRMLIAQGQAPVLAQYVSTSKDSNLITWWGHYLESIGDLDGALVAYARANDFGEQTRLLCYMDRIEEAEKLCQKNKSSLYQMARYLEMSANQTENAVKMYIKCGAITSAIRVAAEASAWNLVWRAGSSSPKHAVYAASILENAGQNERAIALYQKADKPHMALKLALSCDDTAAMITAAESLGDRVEPGLARALAERLRKAERPGHAAAVLAGAGKYEEALDIVEQTSAPLSEELGERLAAPPGADGRDALLRRLADVLGARGLYHQAAKRLAHIGDKAGAMRWLMRSGDCERIATFASASRDRAAQLMAADFLRRRGAWRTRPALARHVLHFYTRARAHDKLAAFHAECAAVEIDEYENYEKALESLKEAARCLGKSSDPESGTQTLAIQEQSTFVKRFIDVKKTLQSGDINTGVVSSEQLMRSVSGRPGLISEEKVLKLVLQYAPDHHEAEKLQMQLNAIQKPTQEDSHTTDSPEQSIEEDLN